MTKAAKLKNKYLQVLAMIIGGGVFLLVAGAAYAKYAGVSLVEVPHSIQKKADGYVTTLNLIKKPTPTMTPVPSPTLVPSPTVTPTPVPPTPKPTISSVRPGFVLISGEYFRDEYCRVGDVEKIKADDRRKLEILTRTWECRQKTSFRNTDPPCYTDEEQEFLTYTKLFFLDNCVSKDAISHFGAATAWKRIGL